jgi:hypothetical protein
VVVLGVTLRLVPVPAEVPPHEPLYHFHVAPVPSDPPDMLSVLLWPLHNVLVPLIVVTGVDVSLTVKVKLLQDVVLHVPSART